MNDNFRSFRLKLIFLALCILILLAIKGHIKLGYAPAPERKSISVAFDYYGAFEKEVEVLVSRLEEAYMELNGLQSINSVSEPGKGCIVCQFSDKTRLEEAYVQISDVTANIWSDFPDGVNRPTIACSSRDTYPVYISYFPREKENDADLIKAAYESIPGVGEVELGGRKRKELMVELHSDRLAGMSLPGDALGSKLRSSNLARKVDMPGWQTLILSSRLSSSADLGRIHMTSGLKLSDVADIEYRDAEDLSLGHIDGRSMLLFFIMKSGEGNTVRLCSQLEKVTSQFGGSQLYSLGNKIEESFIFFSLILLLLFIFLLFARWFKTRSYPLVVQTLCRSMLSLLVAVASVAAAGYQLDMTVMASLSLVIIFCFTVGSSQGRHIDYDCYIQENISAEELKIIIGNMKPSDESVAYKKKYYDDVKDKYAVREFSTTNGKKFSVNTPIKRNPKPHEIDEAFYLLQKGYKVEFLDEPKDGFSHPDLLINGITIVEIKQITGNAYTASNHIVEAMNKQGADVPVIFFMKKAVYLKNEEILGLLNKDRHIKRDVDKIVIVRDYKQISVLNKTTPGATEVAAWRIYTINPPVGNVNFDLIRKQAFALPAIIIFATLIIALYTPIRFKNLVLPFCIALSAGCCASVVFQLFMKENFSPKISIPFWAYSPILLFVLALAPFSPVSPFASDVTFSMEYESGTSFSFIRQSALDVESDLLRWNAFDRLILHVDQGRASFTVIGGRKRDILAKIAEISSRYPEIFFYIPEKHTRNAIDVTVYGNDVSEIENNILQLAKYVNEGTNNVNIIYNFKSDVQNIVLEIPVKCASAGFYPYEVYKTLYYTASEPVMDKYFEGKLETDVKIRGDARYRETLSGLLSVPLLSPYGIAGEVCDYISVRKEMAQGRIYHRNRMRCLSFSVTGISRSKLKKLVSDFPFIGSCHGEVGQ